MMWIALAIFIVVVAAIVVVYKYEDSLFSKATSYSMIEMLTSSRVRTLYKMTNKLKATDEKYDLLFDVALVPNERPIDAIIMHASGIYVVDVEHKKGWIAGREQDVEWTQHLYKEKKVLFSNPVHRVQRNIFAIRELLPEIQDDAYQSIVIFTDDCSFQQIELHSPRIDVIKETDLKSWASQLHGYGQAVDERTIQKAYDTLKTRTNSQKTM